MDFPAKVQIHNFYDEKNTRKMLTDFSRQIEPSQNKSFKIWRKHLKNSICLEK
eukprot:05201.XXX_205968_206126_1 [CDS] Oithona nana genome sequencing.